MKRAHLFDARMLQCITHMYYQHTTKEKVAHCREFLIAMSTASKCGEAPCVASPAVEIA